MVDREVSDVRVFAVGSDGNDANRALVDEGQVRRPSLTAGTYVALRQDDERDWLVVCDERDLVGPNLDRWTARRQFDSSISASSNTTQF